MGGEGDRERRTGGWGGEIGERKAGKGERDTKMGWEDGEDEGGSVGGRGRREEDRGEQYASPVLSLWLERMSAVPHARRHLTWLPQWRRRYLDESGVYAYKNVASPMDTWLTQ